MVGLGALAALLAQGDLYKAHLGLSCPDSIPGACHTFPVFPGLGQPVQAEWSDHIKLELIDQRNITHCDHVELTDVPISLPVVEHTDMMSASTASNDRGTVVYEFDGHCMQADAVTPDKYAWQQGCQTAAILHWMTCKDKAKK